MKGNMDMTYYELAQNEQHKYKYQIVAARVGSQIHELSDIVADENEDIDFLTIGTRIGMRIYQRSLTFLFLKAARIVAPKNSVEILFPIGDSLYIESDDADFHNKLGLIADEMKKMVESDIIFAKEMIGIGNAMKYFKDNGMTEKAELFSYRRVSSITLYDLDGFKNYFYGDLVYSTGILKLFDLVPFKHGALLQFPNYKNPTEVKTSMDGEKLYYKLLGTTKWAKSVEAKTIGDLNNKIVEGKMDELVLLQEAAMERQIADIATDIKERNKKFVLIAGPSSSGKTSFSNRLSIQLRTQGIKCHTIAQDDYFKNRRDIPFDSNGEQNFEAIDVVDLEKFDSDMQKIIDGEVIEIPTFNFKTGEREYNHNHYIQLKKNEVIIIEGIHCLNPRFLPSVNPYRIYISALTPLNIDEHNRISSSDLRMLRRMARDIKHRGTNPQSTIKGWHKVRAGEEENIFPYQENADVIFNSSLVYEVPMMKTLVERMLFSVPKDSNEWVEAKRMLKFLDFFLAYPSDIVPKNSILQEFLDGSCFNVG